jgi:hypothetical protein
MMPPLDLPDDLADFLAAGRQLDYDPEECAAGRVVLLPREQLKLELFATMADSSAIRDEDPHQGENGCYLVPGVNLVASCAGYSPSGILMWLPVERCYAAWDSSHLGIRVFPSTTTWRDIAADAPKYINAQWGNWSRDEALIPWPRHVYCKKQLYGPQPISLINEPGFLVTCVPLHRARREVERVKLVELLHTAAEKMQSLGDSATPPEMGVTWSRLGQSVAEAAEKIAARDKGALQEMWDLFGWPSDAYSPAGLQSAAEEIFTLIDSWLHPDHY